MVEDLRLQVLNRMAALRRGEVGRPVVVGLDGASGSGKSTLAAMLARQMDAALVPLDDFYQTSVPEAELTDYTVEQRLHIVFDWKRVSSEALEPLRRSQPARWHAFDFSRGLGPSGTYGLSPQITEVSPAPVILLEGAYSCSPHLRDLIDVAVLVDAPAPKRHSRILARGDDPEFFTAWHRIWGDVEAYYFETISPPESFDIVIHNE